MDQITGSDEMKLLDETGCEAARLARFARRVGALTAEEDPDLAEWEERLLEIRRALRGPRISAELTCPDCDTRVSLIFGIDELPRAAPSATASSAVEIDGVALRALRLSDLLAVAVETQAEARLELLLARAAGREIGWAEAVLAGDERAAAVSALEPLAAGLDLQIGTACTDCGTEIVTPFDVQSFVLSELEASARLLLDEVHRIAMAYHWSEAEILHLPRSRRQAYLARIERTELRWELTDVGR